MSGWWMWGVFFVLVVGGFGLVEGLAIKYPQRQDTLSFCMAWLGQKCPFSIWVCGVFAGALAFHFWGICM